MQPIVFYLAIVQKEKLNITLIPMELTINLNKHFNNIKKGGVLKINTNELADKYKLKVTTDFTIDEAQGIFTIYLIVRGHEKHIDDLVNDLGISL